MNFRSIRPIDWRSPLPYIRSCYAYRTRRRGGLLLRWFGLPELNRIPLRIVEQGKSSVRILLRINLDLDSGCGELCDHRVEMRNAEIDHPLLRLGPEIFGTGGKRLKR